MILKKSRRILALTLLLAMLLSILPPVAFAATSYQKTTSLAVGDKVVLVYETDTVKKELTSIGSYGVAADYTSQISGSFLLEVVAGATEGSFAFQTPDATYLQYSGSGNSLSANATLDTKSSWTVLFDADGNAVITNVATTNRVLQYNTSSPRFACYKNTQESIQIYLQVTDGCEHANTEPTEVPATCTEPGYTADVCQACGAELNKEPINALGHSFDEGTVETAATCTTPGVMKYACTVCKTVEPKEIPAPGHNYVDGKCTACGTAGTDSTSYKLITLDDVKAGNYIIGAVRSGTYPDIYPATSNVSKYIYVSDTSVEAQNDEITDDMLLQTDAQVYVLEGDNTNGFTIGFEVDGTMKYLGATNFANSNTLSMSADYANIRWTIKAHDEGGFTLWSSEGNYTISQNTSNTSCIRGYKNNGVYDGIYLFAEVPAEEEPTDPTDPTDPAPTECSHANAVIDEKAPTCTEPGYSNWSCPDCGGSKTENIAALGHTPGEPQDYILRNPDCTTAGLKQIIANCTVCGGTASNTEVEIPALGHNFVDSVCDRCYLEDPRKDFTLATKLDTGDLLVLYYPAGATALGNTASDNKLAPSTVTVKDGILSSELDTAVLWVSFADDTNFYLQGEGGSYLTTSESGSALFFSDTANDYSLWYLAPIEGTDLFNIMSTNAAYNGNKNQALEYYNGIFTVYSLKDTDAYKFQLYTYSTEPDVCDHDYVAGEPVPPTCTEEGYTTYTCSLCGDSYNEDFEDALNHDYVAGEPVPPTCTEDGYTVYTCSRCYDSYEDDHVLAQHDYVAGEPVPPTCTEEGYTPYTCTVCNDETKNEFSQPTGHAWIDATCTAPAKCGTCGAIGGGYVQIGSVEELNGGDQIVIATNVDGVYKALGTNITGKTAAVDITVADGMATSDALPVWTLEGSDGNYALSANGQYIAYNSSTNFKSSENAYEWIFEDKEGYITITASSTVDASTVRGILYRTETTNAFGAYATSNIGAKYYYGELLIFKYMEGVTLPHEDGNNNNHCDTCDFAPMKDAVLYGRTLSVKGNIAINFYMCLSEDVIKDGNAYMEFTQQGKEDKEPVKVYIKDCMVKRNAAHTHYSFPYEVAAKEMTDEITAKFFYRGECVGTYTYSVKEYVDSTLPKEGTTAELAQLLKSMLHYGAASQLQFNYNTDRLANADLEEVDYSTVTIDGYPTTAPQGTELAYLAGVSLLLESETTLRFFFKAEISMDQFSASYLGKTLEVNERNGLYYVDVVDIAAQDLDETVTITINDGTQDVEVFYCPLSYCQSVKNDTTGVHTKVLQNCVAALFLYNQDANAYFASLA